LSKEIYNMKRSILIWVFAFFITNVFSQQIVIKPITDNSNKNAPFNDDSSLYPDKYGVYGESEHEPMFPGGDKAYKKFIKENLTWPDKSGMVDVKGKIIVSFVVEKNGLLTNFNVIKKLYPSFDMAVVDALKKSPRWHPGTVKGRRVRVRYSLNFDFDIVDE